MKKTFALFFCLVVFLAANSQVQNPIKWSATYTALSDGEGEILITGIIEKGWHTYSQQKNEAVPLPTLISFKESEKYQVLGEAIEKNVHEEYDAALKEKLLVFTGKAEFKQKVRLKAKGSQTIFLKVEYISCDNKMCLPPTTIDLNVKVQ